jgi:ubiquinone/menaquinone biosynthesis C-methylase UbiE
MGPQVLAFFDGEGEAWLARNKDKLPAPDDPVLRAIQSLKLKPAQVLEVGCADGWRLKELSAHYNCRCYGIDPGIEQYKIDGNVTLHRGSADDIHICRDGAINLLIYGFCLYLCDPEDYFEIAMAGDRVLANGGYLVVYDFWSPVAYKKPYEHKKGIFTRKMDFAKLWTWHPAYSVQSVMMIGEGDECTAVQILRKNLNTAFRLGPPPPL